MNVYIATSLANHANHNLLRDELAKYQIKLSYDWTLPRDPEIPRSEIAWLELQGVKYADLVVVLLPGGRGTHVEFGAALACEKPIIVHGPDEQVCGETGECIFFALEEKAEIIKMTAHSHNIGQPFRFKDDVPRLALLVAQRLKAIEYRQLSEESRREDG